MNPAHRIVRSWTVLALLLAPHLASAAEQTFTIAAPTAYEGDFWTYKMTVLRMEQTVQLVDFEPWLDVGAGESVYFGLYQQDAGNQTTWNGLFASRAPALSL